MPEVIERYKLLVPMFERMRELFHILNLRRRRRGSIDFDLKEPEILLDDQGMVEEIVAAERNVAHRIIEEFMLAGQRDGGPAPRAQQRADALSHSRRARPGEGRDLRGVHLDARLLLVRAVRSRGAARLPAARGADQGQAGREAHRVPDAADDAEGAVRPGESWPLRPRGAGLHALHVAHPPLPGPGRAPRAARVAPRR